MDFSISEFRSTISTVADMYKKGLNQEAEAKLLEIREEFLKLREENLTLRTRLHEIEEIASIKSNMVFEEPYYYLQGDSEKDGPFCQRCFDADDKAIRLIYRKTTAGSYICPQCKVHYGERTKVKPISMSMGF